ncbi:MAG: FAD:protein FMN transferase [Candidatus Marinimicrobia bacterium]|nr:FAD:protein FMN transferase [Candidatus Neomarinimicrobiota bacterium]MCF7851170.1 FAD:protein FMN transferase [Candidatus Neomarinimicrobiota bacterium]MCF7904246.1 FAD:protein FMN transferase [Candidatus Neomarinimicrobiota bacterium]
MMRYGMVKQLHAKYFVVACLLVLILCSCSGRDDKFQEFSINGSTMGTSYHITIVGDSIGTYERSQIGTLVDSVLIDYNHILSTYEDESEISVFNQQETTFPIQVSSDLIRVTRVGLELCQRSAGAFDITVMPIVNFFGFGFEEGRDRFPTIDEIDAWLELTGCDKIEINANNLRKTDPRVSIDLSAIAKGDAADVVTAYLMSRGYKNLFVEIGGEIMTRGVNRYGKSWKIGIDRPTFGGAPGADLQHIIELADMGVATSGDYRNYREVEGRRITHMIDPRSGSPITHNLASVTVVSDKCLYADGLATAVMVLGAEEGLRWLEDYPGAEGLLITRASNGEYHESMTSGFDQYIIQ